MPIVKRYGKFIITNKLDIIRQMNKISSDQRTYASVVSPRTMLQRSFFSLKTQMLAEFENLPVTREIRAGPTAENISGTLSTKAGYGNLFSFIGFREGSDPIKNIVEKLTTTNIRFVKVTPKEILYEVDLPSAQEIFAVTPMPWANGRSWAQGIEQGISGLGWYIYRKRGVKGSRSGTAIQTHFSRRSASRPILTKARGSFRKAEFGRFNNTAYISSFLDKWRRIFNTQLTI